jgi:hypothetical protein
MFTGRIVSIALLATSAMLMLTQIGAAQRPAGQSPPSLIVTPASSLAAVHSHPNVLSFE